MCLLEVCTHNFAPGGAESPPIVGIPKTWRTWCLVNYWGTSHGGPLGGGAYGLGTGYWVLTSYTVLNFNFLHQKMGSIVIYFAEQMYLQVVASLITHMTRQ